MHSISHTELADCSVEDVGRIVLMHLGGPVLAIAPTFPECIYQYNAVADRDSQITVDDIDYHTDPAGLMSGDLVAFDII